jgi:hypothetical protein
MTRKLPDSMLDVVRVGVRLLLDGSYGVAFGTVARAVGGHQERGLLGSDRMNRMHEQLLLLGVRRERLDAAQPQNPLLSHPCHPPHASKPSFLMPPAAHEHSSAQRSVFQGL